MSANNQIIQAIAVATRQGDLLSMARQRVIIVAIQSPVQAMSTAMAWMI
jgi:hypothetical protein